jgi:voltage-gated sodium channel
MVQPDPSITLSPSRQRAAQWVESSTAVTAITVLILINAVTLGLETDQRIVARYGSLLHAIDFAILLVFTVELLLKFYAYRLSFFRSGWNIFDLLIVAIAWVPTSGSLAVLRTLRVLRVLRLLSVVPQMRRVISAIGHSIPGMLSVIGVLGILFYVSAVLTTKLFGQHPDPEMQLWFGSIGASAYTLFQVMTLESWSMGIVRPVMSHFPWAWLFFVPFIIITSFAVLNLFIGIIVDAMQIVQQDSRGEVAGESGSGADSGSNNTTVTTASQDGAGTEPLERKIDQLNDTVEELKTLIAQLQRDNASNR